MSAPPNRHTPLTQEPIDPASGDALLVEYDRDGAQLAVEALSRIQNELRLTPSRTHAQRRRRRDLIEQARAQKAYLDTLGVEIRTHIDDSPERARALRVRRAKARARYLAMSCGGIGVVVLAIGACVAAGIAVFRADPAEQGRDARQTLEVIARNELRFAARNQGRYTETIQKLRDVERQTNGSSSHGDDLLYYHGDEFSIIAQNGTFSVSRTDAPHFSLRRNQDGTFTATCAASEQHGCKDGKWSLSTDLPTRR